MYTIGDCYVILSVKNAQFRNPAQEAYNVCLVGFEMVSILEEMRKKPEFSSLNMRIGIHTVIINSLKSFTDCSLRKGVDIFF